jgi:hypothetical protein
LFFFFFFFFLSSPADIARRASLCARPRWHPHRGSRGANPKIVAFLRDLTEESYLCVARDAAV